MLYVLITIASNLFSSSFILSEFTCPPKLMNCEQPHLIDPTDRLRRPGSFGLQHRNGIPTQYIRVACRIYIPELFEVLLQLLGYLGWSVHFFGILHGMSLPLLKKKTFF